MSWGRNKELFIQEVFPPIKHFPVYLRNLNYFSGKSDGVPFIFWYFVLRIIMKMPDRTGTLGRY